MINEHRGTCIFYYLFFFTQSAFKNQHNCNKKNPQLPYYWITKQCVSETPLSILRGSKGRCSARTPRLQEFWWKEIPTQSCLNDDAAARQEYLYDFLVLLFDIENCRIAVAGICWNWILSSVKHSRILQRTLEPVIAWNQPCEEYLHHGHRQTLQIRCLCLPVCLCPPSALLQHQWQMHHNSGETWFIPKKSSQLFCWSLLNTTQIKLRPWESEWAKQERMEEKT